jgi:hypothetical protein
MITLQFNTGREYSQYGQRIMATQLDTGHIIMVDLDRHIDLMLLAGVGFNQREIMQAYDHAWTTFPEKINMSYSEYYDIVRELRELASA